MTAAEERRLTLLIVGPAMASTPVAQVAAALSIEPPDTRLITAYVDWGANQTVLLLSSFAYARVLDAGEIPRRSAVR